MATDVGGGTSLSMQRNLLAEAYKVQALSRPAALSAWAALHAATRGARPRPCSWPHEDRWHFEPRYRWRTFAVWDWARWPGGAPPRRRGLRPGGAAAMSLKTLHARVFAWMTLSDERNLVQLLDRRAGAAVRRGSVPPRRPLCLPRQCPPDCTCAGACDGFKTMKHP